MPVENLPADTATPDAMSDDQLSSAFVDAMDQSPVTQDATSQPTAPDPVAPGPTESSPESPVEAPSQSQPVAPTEPSSPADYQPSETLAPLLENARQLGISTEGMTSESELANAVMRQIQSMQPYVNFAKQVIPHTDKIRDVITQPPGQAPQSHPQEAAPSGSEGGFDPNNYLNEKYGGPSWKPEFQQAIDAGMVQRNPENGYWQAAPGFEVMAANLLPDMNAAQQHSSQFWQKVAQGNPYENFYGVLKEPLMHEVRSVVEELISGREQASQQQDVVAKFENEHASWLYQTDPATGQRLPTQNGSKFFDTVSELQSNGMTDPAKILSIASRLHGVGSQAPASQAPSQPPAQAPVQPPSQAPVQPTQPPTQPVAQQPAQPAPGQPAAATQAQSFIENALQRASHSTTAATTPDQPQAVSEGDLEAMFLNAARSHGM